MGVDIFFSLMRSYFCLLVAALRPCQGREPRLKYIRTYPSDSRSSRLDCSVTDREDTVGGSASCRNISSRPHMDACLTDAKVCVNGGVAGRASQVLIFAIGDVLVCASIAVFLSQTKVNDVDQVAFLAQPHQKVVGLHISVDEVLGVDVFDPADLEKQVRQTLNTQQGGTESAAVPMKDASKHSSATFQPTNKKGERNEGRYSTPLTIWSASRRTVFRLNFREQKLNRSSRLGPSSSITITL